MKTKNIENKPNAVFPDPLGEIHSVPRPVVAMARDYPPDHLIAEHRHSRSQLLYASAGVMSVATAQGLWVVPPQRGVWIPAGTRHSIQCSGAVSLRTLYLDPAVCGAMPAQCRVVAVSPLLRELIIAATALPRLYEPGSPAERVMQVILDQVEGLEVSPLELVIPGDPRLKGIYDGLRADPADRRGLAEWGRQVGASPRTLARLFQAETGVSFRQWRQQVRILEALSRLGLGHSVTRVALEVGYNSPSAFIAMFKKALGRTPREYFQEG